jgi:hypothetical protein
MSQLADIEVHLMRWRLRLSHGVNQEIHPMAIISQDAIKLGCSGGQGKTHAQTMFEHATQIVQQLRLRRTSVENVRQIDLFLQNKANFQKSQMDVKLNISRDYEKKSKWTFGENKPNF